MKTKKHTPYWYREINNAIKREKKGLKPFLYKVVKKAEYWTTCACGKQDTCLMLEDRSDGPIDSKLRDLGMDFMYEVENQEPRNALRTILKIEKRAGQLLRRRK